MSGHHSPAPYTICWPIDWHHWYFFLCTQSTASAARSSGEGRGGGLVGAGLADILGNEEERWRVRGGGGGCGVVSGTAVTLPLSRRLSGSTIVSQCNKRYTRVHISELILELDREHE
jgi:hypothetical protein